MIDYHQHFSKDFAQLIEPMVYLLRYAPFKRGPAQKEAFEALNTTIKEAPILVYPYFDNKFILYTASRNLAVGVILVQLDEMNKTI